MNIVISGASGDLGLRTTRELLRLGHGQNLTLASRTPETVAAEAIAAGARVCVSDFNDPDSLEAAFAGNEVLFLISGLAVSRRVPEHRNAIEAAKRAGIRHIVYTSTAGLLPQNPTLSAKDHAVTEQDLRDSGLGFTILRNAFYAESLAENFAPPALASGEWRQLEGDGRMAIVSKADIARCAAVILGDPAPHHTAVYEISGREMFSFREMCALVSDVWNTPIEFIPMSFEERLAMFDAAGVPRTYSEGMDPHPVFHYWASDEMLSADRGYNGGFHEIVSGHVKLISGREPLLLRDILNEYKNRS